MYFQGTLFGVRGRWKVKRKGSKITSTYDQGIEQVLKKLFWVWIVFPMDRFEMFFQGTLFVTGGRRKRKRRRRDVLRQISNTPEDVFLRRIRKLALHKFLRALLELQKFWRGSSSVTIRIRNSKFQKVYPQLLDGGHLHRLQWWKSQKWAKVFESAHI